MSNKSIVDMIETIEHFGRHKPVIQFTMFWGKSILMNLKADSDGWLQLSTS